MINQTLGAALEADNADAACLALDQLGSTEVEPDTRRKLLRLAAEKGHTGLIERLHRTGSVNEPIGDFGETALHVAAQNNHVGAVHWLVGLGSDVAQCDEDGMTPAVWAAEAGSLDAAKALASPGNEKDPQALCAAARMGHHELVAELLECPGVRDSYAEDEINAALAQAIASGHEGCVEVAMLLVSKGASPEIEIGGRTLLQACRRCFRDDLARAMRSEELKRSLGLAMNSEGGTSAGTPEPPMSMHGVL